MQAIRVEAAGGPEVMQLQDVADLQPGPEQVVVDVRAIGVNPVDTYIRSGTYAIKPQLPYTPGMEGAGVIARVGGKVKNWKIGDRVYIAGAQSGTYAEEALCNANQVQSLPDNVSFAQGAAVYVAYATAYRALSHKAHAQAGETVLVHGASGGVGIAAVQIAVAHGMTVIGTAGSARGIKLVEEQGVEYVLNHNDSDYLSDILGATCGRGVDVILEMLANENLGHDLTLLANGGRVVVIGNRGTVEINPREMMGREASICGMTLMSASQSELDSIHAAIVAGLKNGSLRPVVGEEIPLAEAARAHQVVMQNNSHGKVVLVTE